MLRKTTAAVVLAGALALGTASATDLGDFSSPTFAASDVGLLPCAVTDTPDLMSLIPEIPTVGSSVDATVSTLALSTLDVTSITEELDSIVGVDCLTDKLLDVVLLNSADAVLGSVTVDLDPAAATDFTSVELTAGTLVDIIDVDDVRVVLRQNPDDDTV